MIRNIQELADHVGAARADDAAIRRRLFKDTSCGIGFASTETGIVVAGYCEGTDDCCPEHALDYPFTADAFDEAVKAADEDGCRLWDETHGCEDCGLDGAVNPECPTCKGEGEVL